MYHDICCEELFSLGGPRRFDRGCWTLELADVIADVGYGRYAFYVVVEGQRVDLALGRRDDGTPYLRPADPAAEADGGFASLPGLGEPGG